MIPLDPTPRAGAPSNRHDLPWKTVLPARITISTNSTTTMARPIRNPRPKLDLEAEAITALEEACAMPHGPERTEAMKRAGILRNAADLRGLLSAKGGRPAKT